MSTFGGRLDEEFPKSGLGSRHRVDINVNVDADREPAARGAEARRSSIRIAAALERIADALENFKGKDAE